MAPASNVPPLFSALFDDAALFPPGNAPMGRAVPEHRAHERSFHAELVGPFVCPDTRLPELIAELKTEEPARGLAVSVVVSGGPSAVEPVCAALVDERSVRLVALEIPLGRDRGAPDRAATAAACMSRWAPAIPAYFEVPRGDELEDVLDVLAEHRVRAKLRTGGPTPASFLSEEEVAVFLHRCASREMTFKCTAGLHAGVRHDVPVAATGEVLEQQGFLNILLATAASVEGAGLDEIAALLAERDEALVVKAVAALDPEHVMRARRRFRSFGTCSVAEPIADLVRLGLLGAYLAA
jgi:hypothetical protein